MNTSLLAGRLVRLGAREPDEVGRAFARWERDSEYHRLLDNDPNHLWSVRQYQTWQRAEQENESLDQFTFAIITLADNRLVGFIGMGGFQWSHGEAWVGIGLGERDDWGKGYGTDAMQVILLYAFRELNLFRVTLGVFSYNPRAIRSYEKAGFTVEGRVRQIVARDGQRSDEIVMGILRSEWETQTNDSNSTRLI